jgi:peptidase C13-like protein
MLVRVAATLILALLAGGCTPEAAPPPSPQSQPATMPLPASGAVPANRWHALLVAGDNSSPAFANGVDTLHDRLAALGIKNIRLLFAGDAARLSSSTNVRNALGTLGGEACLVYVTSHGEERGFFLGPDDRLFGPAAFERALTAGCGVLPTVVVVSACHSGNFINDQTKKPNRIIMTAAAADRTSFGCGADDDYTYYDQCFLQTLDGGAGTWRELGLGTRTCVQTLERRLGVGAESRPQLFVGAAVANLRIPGR